MSPEAFDATCRALPGATMDIQWGADSVYKVGGKMFAVLGPEHSWSCKCSEIAFEALTTGGPGKPAPYLARASWVWFAALDVLGDDDIAGLLGQAHGLVAAKLTRRARGALGLTS